MEKIKLFRKSAILGRTYVEQQEKGHSHLDSQISWLNPGDDEVMDVTPDYLIYIPNMLSGGDHTTTSITKFLSIMEHLVCSQPTLVYGWHLLDL